MFSASAKKFCMPINLLLTRSVALAWLAATASTGILVTSMATVQTEVPPAIRLAVTVRVVAGVRAVAGPVRAPVVVSNETPAGKTPETEYEEAEKPGLGKRVKFWFKYAI